MNKEELLKELLNDEEFIQKLAAKVAPIVTEQFTKQVETLFNKYMGNQKTKDEDDDIIDEKLIKVVKILDDLETKRFVRTIVFRRLAYSK